MVNSPASSGSDLVLDCVIDDCDNKESGDSVGDDVVVVNGMIVSAREHAVKRPL